MAQKKWTNFQMTNHRVLLKLEWWNSNQMKFHWNLFRMVCGFLAMQAIEMVEMAFWKKSIIFQKICLISIWIFPMTSWSYQSKKKTNKTSFNCFWNVVWLCAHVSNKNCWNSLSKKYWPPKTCQAMVWSLDNCMHLTNFFGLIFSEGDFNQFYGLHGQKTMYHLK